MDAQGRGRAGGIDPADQWVFDPKTGSYELRLDQAEEAGKAPGHSSGSTADATAASAKPRSPKAPPGRRAVPPQRGGGGGGRRAGAKPAVGRRRPKPKKSTKKKVLLWTGGSLAFVLVGGSLGGYLLYQHFNNNLNKIDVGVDNAAVTKGPVNILVIGTDKRDGKGNQGYGDEGSVGHADTTLLFHVSEDRSNATALSIPRDMITDIPECTTKKDGTTKTIPGSTGVRFNESLGQEERDPGCTWRTVEALTGLKVSHFMMADFNAVKQMSSAVGGVEVCLGKDIDDPKSHLKLSKGRHKIEGEDALAFVRTRHSVGFESDLDRIKLQQQFLSSMIREMKSDDTFTNPKKLYDLGDAATKSLTVDTGIGSVSNLTKLAKDLSRVNIKNISFVTVPVKDNPAEGKNHKTVVLDKTKSDPLFAMVRDDVSLTEVKEKEKKEQEKADAAQDALLKGPKAEPANVRVKVLNGSGRIGAAQEAVVWMQNTKGMRHTSNGGNAVGGKKLDKTVLEFAPNQADQARRLAEVMGLPVEALKVGKTDAAPTAEMTLTLGADFKAAGTPVSVPTPTKAPEGIQKVEADDKNICAK
ncbi:LytR family transcriptional regulator [Streptomyces eurocidicus]|uniref:LCP family protein required for cell wall assembly n=1 Tax=Streptomyces eurocidicus TaxID=66423 RepID=A0A2N8NM52_STREU|nr:LCP family protein [Streptomyces eurocidicus]MBB5123005.1 LCP family protein required for cell wall assembly [Streptomyces eurocidicus]MBF6054888.1 LytR family transcriptional regulator [Streptomyces eurocidicus]PNE29827.1 LytR family transcriptional regulator [Streptomyces eurocidicus]